MRIFKIKSHAKINLALNVIGKQTQLHKIESIISFIDLHDLIYLKQINKKNHKVLLHLYLNYWIKKIFSITRNSKLKLSKMYHKKQVWVVAQ